MMLDFQARAAGGRTAPSSSDLKAAGGDPAPSSPDLWAACGRPVPSSTYLEAAGGDPFGQPRPSSSPYPMAAGRNPEPSSPDLWDSGGRPAPSSSDLKAAVGPSWLGLLAAGEPHGRKGLPYRSYRQERRERDAYRHRHCDLTKGMGALDLAVGSPRTASWLHEAPTPVQTQTMPIERWAASQDLLDMEEPEEDEYYKALVDKFIAAAYPAGMDGAVATEPGQQEAETTPRASAHGMEARLVAELGSAAVVSTSHEVRSASLVADMRMVPLERWTWKYQTTEDGPNGLPVLSPMRKQPTKDSCMPAALRAVMESNLRVQHKKDSILSVDHLMLLALEGKTKFPSEKVPVRRLLRMVKDEGVLSEKDYRNLQIASGRDAFRYHITECFYYAVADPGNMTRALYKLRKGGPLMGVIKISENYDKCYKTGQIYKYDPNLDKDEEGKPKLLTHAVCVVSFAIEKSAYLECQDSQGETFAKEGFLKIDVTSFNQLWSIVV